MSLNRATLFHVRGGMPVICFRIHERDFPRAMATSTYFRHVQNLDPDRQFSIYSNLGVTVIMIMRYTIKAKCKDMYVYKQINSKADVDVHIMYMKLYNRDKLHEE